jgi:hypothetical protein
MNVFNFCLCVSLDGQLLAAKHGGIEPIFQVDFPSDRRVFDAVEDRCSTMAEGDGYRTFVFLRRQSPDNRCSPTPSHLWLGFTH